MHALLRLLSFLRPYRTLTIGAYVCLLLNSTFTLLVPYLLGIAVEAAHGEKCPRCWNYREVGEDASHPDVCGRCADVLTQLGK